ncbi:MAG: sporulation transcriptional regulator SpoIIID [Anaeroplasmataceae bacterium]|nr:sporulation transcriptional regulator SpoIIID [Anaeroplasmataceae bacterium]
MLEHKSRVLEMAYLMLEGRRTVREVAKIIGYSKSTVHFDLTTKLEKIDPLLYEEVKELLDYNKKIRHLRGGEATRMKYQQESQFEKHPNLSTEYQQSCRYKNPPLA